MRKFIAACFAVFIISGAAATTIDKEEVNIDLADSEVDVEMEVSELTANRFSYLVNYPVESLNVNINGEKVECEVEKLQIGSEISCERPKRDNFSVSMHFKISDIVTSRQETQFFEYTRNFDRPTEKFRLRVFLPTGGRLVEEDDVSTSVISPSADDISSDGQKIFVEWNMDPDLGGEPVNFQIAYNQQPSSNINLYQGAALALTAAILSLLGYFLYRRLNQEDIENTYSDLEDDEIEVLEVLRENDGSMLQKEVVDTLDYSKAKISGVVSNLVEEDILLKEKEGRSNRLSISKGYRS